MKSRFPFGDDVLLLLTLLLFALLALDLLLDETELIELTELEELDVTLLLALLVPPELLLEALVVIELPLPFPLLLATAPEWPVHPKQLAIVIVRKADRKRMLRISSPKCVAMTEKMNKAELPTKRIS